MNLAFDIQVVTDKLSEIFSSKTTGDDAPVEPFQFNHSFYSYLLIHRLIIELVDLVVFLYGFSYFSIIVVPHW